MDYLAHFNLTDRPFKNTYDGRFFYRTAAAENIFRFLKDGGERPPLVHIKGLDQVGKTFLLRRLGLELKEAGRTALILNPHLTLAEMLRQALTDFGLSHKFSAQTQEEELLGYYQNATSDFLADRQNVFLAVDNAAELPPAMLAELHWLTDLEPGWRGRVSLILCGSSERPWPVVPDRMPETRELTLPPLSAREIEGYVSARLKAAGGRPLFSRAALKILGDYSQGRPEAVNRLAERGLIAAWSAGRAKVGPAQMAAARTSLEAPQNLDYDRLAEAARGQATRPARPSRRKLWRLLLPALLLGGLGYYWGTTPKPAPEPEPASAAGAAAEAEIGPAETATPAGTPEAEAPSLPSPPGQLLTLPQGTLALVVDQTGRTGRLWQGGARGPGLKAEIKTPAFKNRGLYLFGRPRGQAPLIFQYPPSREMPTGEALAIWPRVATLLPQNILPVIVAQANALNAPDRSEDLAAIDSRFKAWVQSQQYKFPDTTASLYAASFQFFELGQPPHSLSREDFRQALNSEARTSGEIHLATSQPLLMRDPKNERLIWAVFNLKYDSRLRHDMGLRVLVFERAIMGGPDSWLIAAELWLPEKSLEGD
jgi:type II secretory pathway predicted ATPase ExeA